MVEALQGVSAYARVHRFVQALVPEPGDQNLPVNNAAPLDTDVDVAALQRLAKKRNDIAMAQLTMAFVADAKLAMIYEAKSPTDWPNGKASCVVDSLFKKYCPQDTALLVELQEELNSVTMKPTDDPAVLFGKLSAIRIKYNNAQIQVSL
jgi:hypothetical protein